MLFSLAALVEQHPSKLVLHSLAGALTLSINTMAQMVRISCLHGHPDGAQASRVPNPCHLSSPLTKQNRK